MVAGAVGLQRAPGDTAGFVQIEGQAAVPTGIIDDDGNRVGRESMALTGQ